MANEKPTFAAGPSLGDLPKRKPGTGRPFDQESANALLSLATASEGATATDNRTFSERKEANNAAAGARRLLERVRPKGTIVKSKVWESDGSFRWAIYLAAEKDKKAK